MAGKKLYKSKDQKVCGVCGGIGEYFGIDPTIVRIIWAVVSFLFTGGTGIIIYFILAFVMEDAPEDYIASDAQYREVKRQDTYSESSSNQKTENYDEGEPVGFDPRKM